MAIIDEFLLETTKKNGITHINKSGYKISNQKRKKNISELIDENFEFFLSRK